MSSNWGHQNQESGPNPDFWSHGYSDSGQQTFCSLFLWTIPGNIWGALYPIWGRLHHGLPHQESQSLTRLCCITEIRCDWAKLMPFSESACKIHTKHQFYKVFMTLNFAGLHYERFPPETKQCPDIPNIVPGFCWSWVKIYMEFSLACPLTVH